MKIILLGTKLFNVKIIFIFNNEMIGGRILHDKLIIIE